MRRLVGLTEQQLADRFGVHLRTIQRWESGEHPVGSSTGDELATLANIDKHDVKYFFTCIRSP